jgi:hypothetical protein
MVTLIRYQLRIVGGDQFRGRERISLREVEFSSFVGIEFVVSTG